MYSMSRASTCLPCGYDMLGRSDGDLCPECGTPFDSRPDWPMARRDARWVYRTGLLSLVLWIIPLLAPLCFLLACLTVAMASFRAPDAKARGVPARYLRRFKLGEAFAWISLSILILVITAVVRITYQ